MLRAGMAASMGAFWRHHTIISSCLLYRTCQHVPRRAGSREFHQKGERFEAVSPWEALPRGFSQSEHVPLVVFQVSPLTSWTLYFPSLKACH